MNGMRSKANRPEKALFYEASQEFGNGIHGKPELCAISGHHDIGPGVEGLARLVQEPDPAPEFLIAQLAAIR